MPDAGNHTVLQDLGYWEVNKLHYHTGTPVEVVFRLPLNWGEDGRLTASVVNPAGEQGVPDLLEGGAGTYTISFTPETEGYYQLLLEQERGLSTHLAKAILPVGHHLHGTLLPVGGELELVPVEWKSWQAGDVIKLRVMRGNQPVAGAATLFYRGPLDEMQPVTQSAGAGREVQFALPQPGNYVVAVKAGAAGEGGETAASLPVLVTKAGRPDHTHHGTHHHHG